MKRFTDKKMWIIIGSVLGACLVLSGISLLLWEKKLMPKPGVKFYGLSDEISLENYLPLTQANEMLKKYEGLAFQTGDNVVYVNGEYKNVGEPLCSKNGDKIVIDCDGLAKKTGLSLATGKITAEELAEKCGAALKIYEDKLVVFLKGGEDVNVFDNYHTFEMISLKLREAPADDFKNAFITLPAEITNGTTVVKKYSDPDLDLGLQTELYSLQKDNENTEKRPIIVAGEGDNANNHTVIRVFNEYQVKISQFMAFSADVTGGVKISAGSLKTGDSERGLIAAASINGRNFESKHVRVFDEYGTLYMEIVPQFMIRAPYNVLMGRFLREDSDLQLLVLPRGTDVNACLEFEIYSLRDGSLLKSGKFEELGVKNKNTKISRFTDDIDDVLMFVDEENVFRFSFENGKITKTPICKENDYISNGVYQAAFDGVDYVCSENMKKVDDPESTELNHKSFLKIYPAGSQSFTRLDVGHSENMIYFNENDFENTVVESEYVKNAGFKHMRPDMNSRVIIHAKSKLTAEELAETEYSEWESAEKIRNYAESYNVWEPCFTHRWGYTNGLTILSEYKNADGSLRYSSVDRNGEKSVYKELNSLFHVGTYADGILELDKMRIYPLRIILNELHDEFVKDPEKLVALEPVHEIEINAGVDSVGDYNSSMIETFRSYLISRYGDVENINRLFGTDFKSRADIMAPTNTDPSKAWDKYEGKYFDEWTLFTRQIINKRLAEADREALLAGFAPEIICGHSIPEGDAIEGFLGEANTRISPIDAMMNLGCSFGATRYGYWCESTTNFLKSAYVAGFRNSTLGEYNSMTNKSELSYDQMIYVISHGAKFVNLIGAVHERGNKNDMEALTRIAEKGTFRRGQTNGVKATLPYDTGSKKYQIVEIGGDGETSGLLKSVDAEGKWTGDVYLTPFHAHIDVESFGLSTNVRSGAVGATISDLNIGDVVELDFIGGCKSKNGAKLHIDVYENGVKNEVLSGVLNLTDGIRSYKYVLSNDVVLGAIKIKTYFECENYRDVTVKSFTGNIMRENVARVFFGDETAAFTKCGVFFDTIR